MAGLHRGVVSASVVRSSATSGRHCRAALPLLTTIARQLRLLRQRHASETGSRLAGLRPPLCTHLTRRAAVLSGWRLKLKSSSTTGVVLFLLFASVENGFTSRATSTRLRLWTWKKHRIDYSVTFALGAEGGRRSGATSRVQEKSIFSRFWIDSFPETGNPQGLLKLRELSAR